MVEHKRATSLCTAHQQREQAHADNHVHLARYISHIHTLFRAPSAVPRVQVDKEDDIVHNRVSDGNLDSWDHGAFGLALCVLLPRTAILTYHAHELFIARHNGRDGGEETGT